RPRPKTRPFIYLVKNKKKQNICQSTIAISFIFRNIGFKTTSLRLLIPSRILNVVRRVNTNVSLKSMMDVQEPGQEFRCLATESTPQAVSDDEMVLNYSDSEDDRSSKESKNGNPKEALELLDKDNQMATDDGISGKESNGAAIFSETSDEKANDESVRESDYLPTKLNDNDDMEKLSLLDRFLSSEVVENSKEIANDLIGDELIDDLVDETTSEVIDENALLDEITNDLDNNEDEIDEQCLLGEDLIDFDAKDVNLTSEEVTRDTSSKSNEDEKVTDSDQNRVMRETLVENYEAIPSAETEPMEVDNQENIANSSVPDSPKPSCEVITETAEKVTTENSVDEHKTETCEDIPKIDGEDIPKIDGEDIPKIDEDQDNNLLEEMADSPRSSEHESMTSDLLEKDDTVTHDSTDDQQMIHESSNDNSNMSETGVMPENELDVDEEYNHDAEMELMDDTCDIDEEIVGQEKDVKEESHLDTPEQDVVSEVSVETNVKEEELVTVEQISEISSENIEQSGEVSTVEDTANKTNKSVESACKRKSLEHIEQPEVKKQRIEEDIVNLGSTVNGVQVADSNKVDEVPSTAVVHAGETETNENGKDDDDDVLIIDEGRDADKLPDAEPSTLTETQEPVEKAKILILDTQAIEKDLCEETASKEKSDESSAAAENDSALPSSQAEVSIEKIPNTPSLEKTVTEKPKTETPLILDPVPQKTLCPTAFSLHFVRKFNKNFDKMTRHDLEELLIQKCVEVIVHKSEYADMRNKIEKQETKLSSYNAKYQELSKQYRDLEMVHQRVVKDLELKNQSVITPVKITRAVGLQVSLPRKEIAMQKPPQGMPPSQMQSIAQNNANVSAAALAAARNRRKIPLQRPNDPNVNAQQQQMQQQQMIRQNMAMARKPDLQMQQRSQFHLQQQQQQNQQPMLKQQLIQNNNPNNIRQTINVRKPLTQFSPTAAGQLQNASPKTPGSAERPRVPPVILKKMTPTRTVTVNHPGPKDPKRVTQNGTHPPALVAIPNSQATKTVVGQVPIAPKNGTTGQIVQLRKQQPATTLTPVTRRQHPAPLPYPNNQPNNPYWKQIPPRPIIRINNIESGIVISWTMDEMTDKHADVASYQIYAYQETAAAPSPETWRHVGDVKAMLLPMAVTLTQFQEDTTIVK
ncbi:Activating transcription factor 7-interacting protein 1, partial [Pseudolycoriella hygida]